MSEFENAHPRASDGRFTTKDVEEARGGTEALVAQVTIEHDPQGFAIDREALATRRTYNVEVAVPFTDADGRVQEAKGRRLAWTERGAERKARRMSKRLRDQAARTQALGPSTTRHYTEGRGARP